MHGVVALAVMHVVAALLLSEGVCVCHCGTPRTLVEHHSGWGFTNVMTPSKTCHIFTH